MQVMSGSHIAAQKGDERGRNHSHTKCSMVRAYRERVQLRWTGPGTSHEVSDTRKSCEGHPPVKELSTLPHIRSALIAFRRDHMNAHVAPLFRTSRVCDCRHPSHLTSHLKRQTRRSSSSGCWRSGRQHESRTRDHQMHGKEHRQDYMTADSICRRTKACHHGLLCCGPLLLLVLSLTMPVLSVTVESRDVRTTLEIESDIQRNLDSGGDKFVRRQLHSRASDVRCRIPERELTSLAVATCQRTVQNATRRQ